MSHLSLSFIIFFLLDFIHSSPIPFFSILAFSLAKSSSTIFLGQNQIRFPLVPAIGISVPLSDGISGRTDDRDGITQNVALVNDPSYTVEIQSSLSQPFVISIF